MVTSFSLKAQSGFYYLENIQEIKLYFNTSNWDNVLDSLYIEGNGDRLLGDLEINGVYFEDVGIRYKGFSSYSSSRSKNPFNIKLDFVHNDQNYDGIDKIKLSNVIQDPSFIRETLSYEIARKYMPAPQANYANVYVNDTLIGLYTNVEAIDQHFLNQHFSNSSGTFFKCNPEDLNLNGENSNLSNSLGDDVSEYTHLYNQKSDNLEDWSNFWNLIDQLNNSSDNLESILNIDRTLWMHAFNYNLINFDSYIGYAQNYYLYQDETGQFNPVLWDLNMSFASFRFTDASNHWSGFSIVEAYTIDPLLHLNSVSVYPRPLMRQLFENPTFKKMYIAHIRTINEENFINLDYYTRGQYLQGVIANAVENDTNKFYSNQDFHDNLDQTVSDLIDYPGILDLMSNRSSYLQNYPGYQGAPTISNIDHFPGNTTAGDTIWITAEVSGSNEVHLAYRFAESEVFKTTEMTDNGTKHDGVANDNIFGMFISDIANTVEYYIYAENDSAGQFSPERAAYEYYTIHSNIAPGDLVINELMAINDQSFADENNQFEDWIELYNASEYKINTKGLYLSDQSESINLWALPDLIIEPNGYLTIWADEDTNQIGWHSNFKLDGSGEEVYLAYDQNTIIDSVSFDQQYPLVSYGRFPNGTGDFISMLPTYNMENQNSDTPILSEVLYLYPNPSQNFVNIKTSLIAPFDLDILSLDGKVIKTLEFNSSELINLSTEYISSGVYLVHLYNETSSISKKLVISK